MGTLGDVMISKPTYTNLHMNEFESHWVFYSNSPVPCLSEKKFSNLLQELKRCAP